MVLSKLIHSASSYTGRLSNYSYHEKVIISKNTFNDFIIKISSNYGNITNPKYVNEKKPKVIKGRKKSLKKITNRKYQGDGSQFGSRLMIKIINTTFDKKYKIGLARNGSITITGGQSEDYRDMISNMKILTDYLNWVLNPEELIESETLNVKMKNYKCYLLDPHHKFNLFKLNEVVNQIPYYYIKSFTETTKLRVTLHMHNDSNDFKKMSIRFYQSGKINFQGAKDEKVLNEVYAFINDIIQTNDIIYSEKESKDDYDKYVANCFDEYKKEIVEHNNIHRQELENLLEMDYK
jgi:hypothetical protein